MHRFELGGEVSIVTFEQLGVEPADVDLHTVLHPAMDERLVQAFVGIGQTDVFSDHPDSNLAFRMGETVDHVVPARKVRVGGVVDPEGAQYLGVQALTVVLQRHAVDRGCIKGRNDRLFTDIAELSDLAAFALRDRMLRAAEQNIWLDTQARQFAHGMLGRLCLKLARRLDIRHKRDVDAHTLVGLQLVSELTDRLHERQAFDITDRAAEFAQDEIVIVLVGQRELLDRVGDVRNHLYGRAEIVAAALSCDDLLVDSARCNVVSLCGRNPGESLVVTQIEVGFRPVVGHIDLAVLIGAHRPGIHVEIGIELPNADLVATRLQKSGERCRHETFAERGDHAAGDENIPRHGGWALGNGADSAQAQTARFDADADAIHRCISD